MSITAPTPAPGPFFQLSNLGLQTTAPQLLQAWLNQMQTAFPGYQPSQGDLEYVLAQVFASWAADTAQLASAGSTELFRQFGTQLFNLPYQLGTPAQTIMTVTAVDQLGHTLAYGTQVSLTLGGAQVGFQTAAPLTIPAGKSTGTVPIIALQNGTGFNGAGAPISLVSQVTWVQSISIASSAAGGVDQETDDAYVNRLAITLQSMAPRPITAQDYSTLAVNFTPAVGTDQQEVGRATAIDGYDPLSNSYNNQREVTVCVTDANGNPLNNDTILAVKAYLQALREVNFLVNVVLPTYSTVYVTVTVKAAPGFPAATVQANVQQALLAYLSPSVFGFPQSQPAGAGATWQNSPYVYLSRVESVIQQASGVDHLVAGTMAVGLAAHPTNTTSDVLLPGAFPLPITNTTSIPLSAITVT